MHVQLWQRPGDGDDDGDDDGDEDGDAPGTLLADVSMPLVLIQKGCSLQGGFAPFEEWFRLKSANKSVATSPSAGSGPASDADASVVAARPPPAPVFVLRLKFELAIEAEYEAHEKRRATIAALRHNVDFCRRQEQQIAGVREQVRMLLLQRQGAGAPADAGACASAAAPLTASPSPPPGGGSGSGGAGGASVPPATARAASERAKALRAETEASAELDGAHGAAARSSFVGRLAAQWEAVASMPHFELGKNATVFGAAVVAMHFFGHNMEV